MYKKFLNIETGKTFVAGAGSQKHYEENKSIKFIGTCNEDGTMIHFDDFPPHEIPKLSKEIKKQIKKVLPKKSHQIEEDFMASDERDEDS